MNTIEFMEKHLADAVDDKYAELCKKVIRELERLNDCEDVLNGNYNSIDEFIQAKNEYFGV